jgi:hypothetical protein
MDISWGIVVTIAVSGGGVRSGSSITGCVVISSVTGNVVVSLWGGLNDVLISSSGVFNYWSSGVVEVNNLGGMVSWGIGGV